MPTVLKLGGSLITEKQSPETVDETALARAAETIAEGPDDLVLVHGGGSFGHHHAERHGVSTTAGTTEAPAVVAIHAAMKRLNDAVIEALHAEDVPAVPVHPFSMASRSAEDALDFSAEHVTRQLAEGFVPVLHGDVVAHAGEGATIVSGDELVVGLAGALSADRVGLSSSVPGVLDEDEAVIDRIDSFAEVAEVLGGSDATDVTGGMAGKVRALLGLDAPAAIFGPESIEPFLRGESPGTLIGGDGERVDRK